MKGTPKRRCIDRKANECNGPEQANLNTQMKFILYEIKCREKNSTHNKQW